MARTIQQIYDEVIAAKNADSNLSGLSSSSQTAIFKLWAFVTATVIHIHEKLWDQFREEMIEIRNSAKAGTLAWYQGKMLEFQYGYQLDVVNNQPVYAVTDEQAQIIKRCSVNESSTGLVQIKVAKEDNSGNPLPLSTAEAQAARGYLDQVKFAGVHTDLISLSADKLRIYSIIYFDSQVSASEVSTAVKAAINTYLSNLPFNGEIAVSSIHSAILSAHTGISRIDLTRVDASSGAGFDLVNSNYIPLSGYAIIDDDPTGDLDATLTFQPL